MTQNSMTALVSGGGSTDSVTGRHRGILYKWNGCSCQNEQGKGSPAYKMPGSQNLYHTCRCMVSKYKTQTSFYYTSISKWYQKKFSVIIITVW